MIIEAHFWFISRGNGCDVVYIRILVFKNLLEEDSSMDIEDITELVDEFIDQLKQEFAELSRQLTVNAEGAAEEVEILGLSQEEAPYLVFNLADPMETIKISQERCRVHTRYIFDMCEGMDPEEETLARAMIAERLRELHAEIHSLFSSTDG